MSYTSDNNCISQNVFNENTVNAFFYNSKDTWNDNYWELSRCLPKPILGIITINEVRIPWIQFDWHPAKEPNNIPRINK